MKGKLIKTGKLYALAVDDIIATTDDYLNTKLGYLYRLSLKNCQAIENGYDLDELAYEKSWNEDSEKGFINGAKAILEILGDKKFSEQQIRKAIELAWRNKDSDKVDIIKTIQQEIEWQVEVVMDRIPADLAPGGWDVFPKLDAENCLILKRVK